MIYGLWNESKLLVNQDEMFTRGSKECKTTFGFKVWTLSIERVLWAEVLRGSRSGHNRKFSSNTPARPTWLIPYDRGQRCRFHWFPGHAATSGALPVACSNEHSLSEEIRFLETAAPYRRASRSCQSSGSAFEPPTLQVEKTCAQYQEILLFHTYTQNVN